MSRASNTGSVLLRANGLPGLLHLVRHVPPAYYVLIAIIVVTVIFVPHLVRVQSIASFIKQSVPLGIAVLGQMLVMRVRSIDLSIGGMFLLVNYMLTSGLLASYPFAMQLVALLLLGATIGLVNGIMIAWVRVSAVIVTLGVSTVLTGIVMFLSSGRPPGRVPEAWRAISSFFVAGVPGPIIIWVVLAIVVAFILRMQVIGRFIAVVGSNPIAAGYSGVAVARTVVIAHVACGVFAAVGAMLFTAAIGVGTVKFGPEVMMNSIAATILGGAAFGSGRGGVLGPFVGVLSFALLFPLLTVFGVQEPGKMIIQGLVIVTAAILYNPKRFG